MGKYNDNFFEGKRPWSRIKDQVLKNYMSPYLAKVNTRGKPILLIDGYAGPGVFDDGTYGSPIIMCEEAEARAKGNYSAYFINAKKKYYNALSREIERRGWSVSVKTLLGDAKLLLRMLYKTLKEQSVFLYLDPFGPTGCDFALLQPFLCRDPNFSTEILLTLSMPGMHRLATPKAAKDERSSKQMIIGFNQQLTDVLGGDYWKNIMWKEGDPETKEFLLIEAYRARLAQYLPFTGFCPVRERIDKRIKYFIVFASHRKDAMLLLNDIMVNAYFSGMHDASFGKGLFRDLDWRETETRHLGGLEDIIIEIVTKYPGEARRSIWLRIVQKHFMRYLEAEYRAAIKKLVSESRLRFISPTGFLNDDCTLYINQLSLFGN